MADTLTLKIEVLDDGSAVVKDFSGNIQDMADGVQEQSTRSTTAFQTLKEKIEEFGASTATQLGVAGALGAVVGFVGKSVTSLAEFENVMTDVQKTTGMTAPEITTLGDALREMATVDLAGIISAEDLGAIAAQAGQLGIQGAPNIEKFTKAIGEMVIATDLSAEQASTDMAEIENVFRSSLEAAGKSAESQTANIGSAFNTLSNTTSATVGQIMDMTRRMGGAASTLGLTVVAMTYGTRYKEDNDANDFDVNYDQAYMTARAYGAPADGANILLTYVAKTPARLSVTDSSAVAALRSDGTDGLRDLLIPDRDIVARSDALTRALAIFADRAWPRISANYDRHEDIAAYQSQLLHVGQVQRLNARGYDRTLLLRRVSTSVLVPGDGQDLVMSMHVEAGSQPPTLEELFQALTPASPQALNELEEYITV